MDEASIEDVLDYVAGLGKEDILSISTMKISIQENRIGGHRKGAGIGIL